MAVRVRDATGANMTDDDPGIEDFHRLQLRVQQSLDGETLENCIMALSSLLTVLISCASRDKPSAQEMLDRVTVAMRENIDHYYDVLRQREIN